MQYFAYGSNLLLARLVERTPSTRRLERARLPGHRLCWHKRGTLDGSGKCDTVPTGDAAEGVWGAVFEIADTERARLDTAEGLGRGYRVVDVQVETADGVLAAFAYVATPDAVDDTLAPFIWYRDLVVAGARESRLPARYISTLADVPAVRDPDANRARRHRSFLALTAPADVDPGPGVAHLELRPATEAEQPAIVDLCRASMPATYGVFMPPELMRPLVEGREVDDYVARMWPRMTVAVGVADVADVANDKLLGVVALDPPVVDLLWVRADLQGRGIGLMLMDRAESILAADHDAAELECFAPNRASIAFYEARGYRAVRTYHEAASGVDRVVMTKRIGG